MSKTLLSIFTVFASVMLLLLNGSEAFATPASQEYLSMNVIVDGAPVPTVYAPQLVQNRALVPIRALSSLGLTFNYDKANQQVIVFNPATKDTVRIIINKKTAYKNGVAVTLDVPAQIINGLTVVPIRFIANQFSLKVDFEATRNLLFLQTANFQAQQPTTTTLTEKRRESILLPWTYSKFAPLSGAQSPPRFGYAYYFKPNDSSSYYFLGGKSLTYIEIRNSVAEVVWQGSTPVNDGWAEEKGIHQVLTNDLLFFGIDRTGFVSYGKFIGDPNARKKVKSGDYTSIIQPIESEK